MSSLGSIPAQFQSEWSRLQRAWEQTSAQWNDPVRQVFVHKYMEGYAPKLGLVSKALDNLVMTIAKAQQHVP